MRIFRRSFLAILILAVILGAIGAGGFFYLTRRPFPQMSGTLQLPGLNSPVTIIRDQYGIPHIYAGNTHDLFFAQGYVHAQDRLWQMEIARRAVSGRASELSVSISALEADKYVRTVGFRRAAEADYEALSEEGKAIVQAYADGVNVFITTHQNSLPIEFTIVGLFGGQGAGYKPEPWTPIDTMQWGKAMAYQQSGDYDMDLFHARVLAKFGEENGAAVLADVLPSYDYANRPLIIPSGVTWKHVPTALVGRPAMGWTAGGVGADIGSNSWVLSGSKTTTGLPLLANDPHIPIQMPAIWYFNSLHCVPVGPECPYAVIGASLLGLPGVVIGHNARIAWGLTNSSADMTDLFLEKITGNQYEFQGQMVDLEVIPEVLKINGKLPEGYIPSDNETSTYDARTHTTTITLNVRFTHHGPIISDVDADTAGFEYAMAYAWTGIKAPEGLMEAVLALNRAAHWDGLRSAIHFAGTPSLTAIYADIEGNIGFQVFGRIPIRGKGNGRVPVPGWTGEYEWTGHIPPEEMPFVYNPPQGYVATANHAIVGPDYPYFISADYDRGYRAQRIVDLIEAKPRLSPDDFAAIQGDDRNLVAEAIVPYLDSLTVEGNAQKVLDAIREWDLNEQRDSIGAGAYEVFWLYLLRNTFDDELGDLARDYVSGSDVNGLAMIRLLAQPNAHWWDNANTPDATETREDILKKSLADAANALTAEFGSDPANWKWGNLHTVTFVSQALGSSPVAFIFNRGPFTVDGGWEIVNATGGSFRTAYPDPRRPDVPPARLATIFRERQSPSLRQIVDMSNLNASLFIHTTGQSGLPYHPHYDDLIDLWRNIQYVPMWWDRGDVEQNAEGTLSLTP